MTASPANRDSTSGVASPGNVRYSIYCTGTDIKQLLLDEAQRRETLAYFAQLRAYKMYLQYGRQDDEISPDDLRRVSGALRAAGYEVAGALVPACQATPYCYNNAGHMAMLQRQAEFCAELFDEIIVDDWLFTVCRCSACAQARGGCSACWARASSGCGWRRHSE